jgi:hypothetical protein
MLLFKFIEMQDKLLLIHITCSLVSCFPFQITNYTNESHVLFLHLITFLEIPLGVEVVLGGSGEKRDDYVPDLLSTTLMVSERSTIV